MNNLKSYIKVICIAYCYGLKDSVAGCYFFIHYDKNKSDTGTLKTDKNQQKCPDNDTVLGVRKPFLRNSVMNGLIYILSSAIHYCILKPMLKKCYVIFGMEEEWEHYVDNAVEAMFIWFWLGPLFILSKPISCMWFEKIAANAFTQRQGTRVSNQTIGLSLSDSIFNIVIQLVCLIQAYVFGSYVGVWGCPLSWIILCLLNSLYSFEYRWSYMGWNLPKRLGYVQQHWPYFLGYGTIQTVLTVGPKSFLTSTFAYALTFPFFLIGANESTPYEAFNVQLPGFKLPVFGLANLLTDKVFKTLASLVLPESLLKARQQKTRSK